MEKEASFAWYRLRGLGLVCLCSFLFFFGAYLNDRRSTAVNGTAAQARPLNRVQTEARSAALSFDVTDEEDSVQVILDILDRYGVHATFFVTGGWADAHPEEAAGIAAAGHDLGSRGPEKRSMVGWTKGEIVQELQTVHEKVRKLTGISMELFRAPFGEYDETLIETVLSCGYLPVGWDIDSEDWKDYGVESIRQKTAENSRLQEGSIIRFHGGAKYTAQALESVITGLVQRGFTPTSVSRLIQSGCTQ